MRKLVLLSLVFVLAFAAVVPVAAQDEMADSTIAEIVLALAEGDEPEFTVLLAAVLAADPVVLEALSYEDGSLTVFAPTDAAFAAFLEAEGLTADDLLADPDLLTLVLAYHVAIGAYYSDDVIEYPGALLGTFLPNTPLIITETGVNDANVIMPDVEASNGVIHVIDTVLMPDFEALFATMEMMGDMEDMGTVADLAVAMSEDAEPEFTSLVAAVLAADESILDLLSDPEASITVFAPTDEAFARVLATLGIEQEILFMNTSLINGVLAFHVTSGVFTADFLAGALEGAGGEINIMTLAGVPVVLTLDGENILADGVPVILADVYAENGVIHVIDGVMQP